MTHKLIQHLKVKRQGTRNTRIKNYINTKLNKKYKPKKLLEGT